MKLRLGTRGSRLALWQARRVTDLLQKTDPKTEVELVIIKTSGDVRSEFGAEIGEQVGEFSSELEKQLLQGEIDAAVHSAKDLPTCIPSSLRVVAYPERADPSDMLVKEKGRSPTRPRAPWWLRGVQEETCFGESAGKRPKPAGFAGMSTEDWKS